MRWWQFLAAWALAGCGPIEPIDTDLTGTTPTGLPPGTTQPSYSDEGSVMLLLKHPEFGAATERIILYGVFADSTRGYHNFATCLAQRSEGYCAADLPMVMDTSIPVDAYTDNTGNGVNGRDIGTAFRLGPYQANGSQPDGVRAYFNPALAPFGSPVDGTLDLSFADGDWGDYDAPDVVPVPDPMVVTLPDPLRSQTLTNGFFELQWVPGLVGQVYLSVETETIKRLFLLQDDGQHFLDVDAIGLTDEDDVKLTLGRWTHVVHEQYGNEIEILVQDLQVLHAQYRDLTGRTQVEGADSCAQALYSTEIQSGRYYGRFAQNTNQLQPSGGCGTQGAGAEQIFRTELNDGGEIDVDYLVFASDASIYLMTSCGDFGTCIDNSDFTGNSVMETVNWVNNTGGPTNVFVVLDSRTGPASDLYLIDVDIVDIEQSPLVDSCAESIYQTALTSAPAGTDRYVGSINGFHNYADPAASNCGIAAPGQEGMVKVELDPGEILDATVDMPGADPVIYLLYNCALSVSCAAGNDADTTESESVSYTNGTGSSEVLYLVVDSQGGSGAFTLDLLIQ